MEASYIYVLPVRDMDQLAVEVTALLLPGFAGRSAVFGSEERVELRFAADLDAGQQATLAACIAAHVPDPLNVLLRLRAAAKSLALADTREAELMRAVLTVLARRLLAQDAAVANATSLADLKARWTAVVAANPISRQAVADLIDGGGAD